MYPVWRAFQAPTILVATWALLPYGRKYVLTEKKLSTKTQEEAQCTAVLGSSVSVHGGSYSFRSW